MPASKETSMKMTNTFTIIVPTGSSSTFLRNLAKNMGWETTITRTKKSDPTKMSEDEYFDMLDHRIAEAEQERLEGRTITMAAEETGEEFINRLLCM